MKLYMYNFDNKFANDNMYTSQKWHSYVVVDIDIQYKLLLTIKLCHMYIAKPYNS